MLTIKIYSNTIEKNLYQIILLGKFNNNIWENFALKKKTTIGIKLSNELRLELFPGWYDSSSFSNLKLYHTKLLYVR